jgi:hypothetical protein
MVFLSVSNKDPLIQFLYDRFLMGLAVVIVLAWRFPGVAKKDGVIHSEWSIKWGKGLCQLDSVRNYEN